MARGANIPYRLSRSPFGQGGYSLVWRGRHRESKVVAAVKRPRTYDDVALERFKREITVQSALDHPNVMPIWEHNVGERWMAMPLAEHSMTTLVEKSGVINGYQLVDIIGQIAAGLSYAHGRGFVHRDVNPNNVLELRDEDGSRWVVGDWGLVYDAPSQGATRLTRRSGLPLGTEGFTAPEAERDPTCNKPQLDVFSIGRLAHYALTGVWPRRSYPMPRPGWLWDDFVANCTAESETARPESMRAVSALLRDMQQEVKTRDFQIDYLLCPQCEKPMTLARCVSCGRVWD